MGIKRKLSSSLLSLCCICGFAAADRTQISELTTEYMWQPIGIDVAQPQFAWKMTSDRYGAEQKTYRVVVADSRDNMTLGKYVYDSGVVNSGISVGVKYAGEPLKPATRYCWRVIVTDEKKNELNSSIAEFETGLLGSKWDNAQWISSPRTQVSPYRSDFVLEYDVKNVGKPGPSTFIYGAKGTDSYCYITIDTRKPAKLIAGAVLYKKNVEYQNIDISDIITSQALANHHVRMTVHGGGDYNLSLQVDGKQVKTKDGKANFGVNCMRDTVGRSDSHLYDIGYVQQQGFDAQFSGISVSDTKWDVLLASDPKTYNAKGDGKVNTWTFNSEINAPMMRNVVNIGKKVKEARLYATARGFYNFYINGKKAGDAYMAPGWTDFRHRIMYDTYDVGYLLQQGKNALAIELGNGWFCSNWGWTGSGWSDQYGYKPSAMAMLKVTYDDGTTESFVTNRDWKVSDNGPLFVDNLYHGVIYDARREIDGWKGTDFDDSKWQHADMMAAPGENVEIQGYVGMKIKNNITLKAVAMKKISGRYIYDMGQNFAGVPRLNNLHGKKGQQIVIRFAEMLFPDQAPENPRPPLTKADYERNRGNMYMDNYRSAISTDYYTFKGDAAGETFEPPFTQHGYRYVSIDGLDAPLALSDVEGIVLESVGNQQSFYESSNKDINKLFNNIVWGQRSNFLAVPTDCPQRDERLGWTGDANVFCRTATYNMMTEPFYKRWFYTVRDQKSANGDTGGYYPCFGNTKNGANNANIEAVTGRGTGWSDFTVIIPWQMYQQYGDKEFIKEHYQSMKNFMNYLESKAKDYIAPDATYWGDWVAPVPTNISLISTAYMGYDARIMAVMAKVLGHDADAKHYEKLYKNVSDAFVKTFFDSEGYTVMNDGKKTRINTQTSYILPLEFLDLPQDIRQKATDHLCNKIKEDGNRLQTGFLGTPYILNVLSNNGHSDLAYTLYTQTEYPSWLFPVKQGATTMWERWNSYTIKEGFGDVGMNSFNHYAYGAVEEWIMSHNLGIQRDEAQPAYKHILLQPEINRNFGKVQGGFNSVYGQITSKWEVTASGTQISFKIPANTTATFTLPVNKKGDLKIVEGKKGVAKKSFADGKAVYELKSGDYKFIRK